MFNQKIKKNYFFLDREDFFLKYSLVGLVSRIYEDQPDIVLAGRHFALSSRLESSEQT